MDEKDLTIRRLTIENARLKAECADLRKQFDPEIQAEKRKKLAAELAKLREREKAIETELAKG